ncbi:hypothetical protein CVT24_001079 [Panaeolus cyanescens]|uniref:F-box domain-containing protein n=1 Tax=Panaeolus cyanescens TaxID=181874 RepID=A0A409VX23_9AGAR|nr:hypothetical protein CVT24_001079 [Panaeolus cyanescens]
MRRTLHRFKVRYLNRYEFSSNSKLGPATFVPGFIPAKPCPSIVDALPIDIIHLIISHYLQDDMETMLALSQTCSLLRQQCYPYIFQTVTIGTHPMIPIHRRETGAKPLSISEAEAHLREFPQIADQIQHLRILDIPGDVRRTKLMPEEENNLQYVLKLPMKRLRTLEFSMFIHWESTSDIVWDALCTMLSSPTLEEVVLITLAIPTNIFGHFGPNVKRLDFRGQLSPLESDRALKSCFLPQDLIIRGTTGAGTLLTQTFAQLSPFNVSKLETLDYYARGPDLVLLDEALSNCARTLRCLKIFVASWGGLPGALTLRRLSSLTSLVLTMDIAMIEFSSAEALDRFHWICSTISSLPDVTSLEKIHILIGIGSVDTACILDIPWGELDAIFACSKQYRCRTLRSVRITIYRETAPILSSEFNCLDMINDLPSIANMMPFLMKTGLLELGTMNTDGVYPDPAQALNITPSSLGQRR